MDTFVNILTEQEFDDILNTDSESFTKISNDNIKSIEYDGNTSKVRNSLILYNILLI